MSCDAQEFEAVALPLEGLSVGRAFVVAGSLLPEFAPDLIGEYIPGGEPT